MRHRPILLAITVVILMMVASCWSPQVKGEDQRLRIDLQLEFTTLRTLSLDLTVGHGLERQGGLEQSSIGLMTDSNFSNGRLNALAKIIFSDITVVPAESLEAPALINNLLFGFNATLNVQSVTEPRVLAADNMFVVSVDKVTLSSQLSPVKIRPLLPLYQFPDAFTSSRDVLRATLEITLPEELSLETKPNLNAQYLRDFDLQSREFSSHFQNTPVYLDPTDSVDYFQYYDLERNEIELVKVATYQQPTIMAGIYLACLLLSFILVKVVGRKYTDRKGYPLSVGLLSWAFIGLFFFPAFLPSSAELFLSLCLGGLLMSVMKLYGGKRLAKRGGARGPRLEPVGPHDLTAYRKPGKGPTLEPVDRGEDEGILDAPSDGFGLDSLLGGGESGQATAPGLEPLTRDGSAPPAGGPDGTDEFKPPTRENAQERAREGILEDEPAGPEPEEPGEIRPDGGGTSDPKSRKVKKIKKGKKVRKKAAGPFEGTDKDEGERDGTGDDDDPGDTTSAADLLDELTEKPASESEDESEDFSDLLGLSESKKAAGPGGTPAPGSAIMPDSGAEGEDEALPELTRKPLTKGDKTALASRLAALDDLKKKL